MAITVVAYDLITTGATFNGGVCSKAFLLTTGHPSSMPGPTAATWGGVAMTQNVRTGGQTCYYLDSPPTGSQVVAWSGGEGHNSAAWVVTTLGVRGGAGVSTVEGDLEIAGTVLAAGDFVLSAGYVEDVTGGLTMTLSSVTAYIHATEESHPSYYEHSRCAYYIAAAAGALTETWSPAYGTDSSGLHIFSHAGPANQVVWL